MKLSLLGVGNAGTRIVDRLVEAEAGTDRNFTDGNVLAFDTTTTAFEETTSIPEERQVLIGDTHPAVTQHESRTETAGNATANDDDGDGDSANSGDGERAGVGGDPDVGASVADEERPEIRRALDRVDETEVDAAILVAGLGGGTGSGVGSVLLEELKSSYEDPVYVLGVLPATTESDDRALTAARAVRTIVPMADAVIPIDNEAWRRDADRIADCYDEINDAIATRIVSLFAAGESDPTSVSEMRIDPTDISRTLGVGGLASIGYATFEAEPDSNGLLARLKRLLGLADDTEANTATDAATIKRLVRRALESKLTLPCDVSATDRVLLILSGPPGDISRKGFETGRYLLEEETGTVEVLAGDEPLAGATTITATVLFSNVTAVPRIEELQRRAVAHLDETSAAAVDDRGFEFQDESADRAPAEQEAERE
ncbi:tubulin/FtsZ family protein [Halopenitus sp. H-Gu1]|uniref:tubulin/FtsZ family protein n=1 Tax=Halopenitus sp. H-Gu1 TaxID=3242697 RepID=UPI00359F071E